MELLGTKELNNLAELTSLVEIRLAFNRLTTLDQWPFARARHLAGNAMLTADFRSNKISKITHSLGIDVNDCRFRGTKLYLNIEKNEMAHPILNVTGLGL